MITWDDVLHLLDVVETELEPKDVPVCGEDFCECCGDCLACYGTDCGQHGCSVCS